MQPGGHLFVAAISVSRFIAPFEVTLFLSFASTANTLSRQPLTTIPTAADLYTPLPLYSRYNIHSQQKDKRPRFGIVLLH